MTEDERDGMIVNELRAMAIVGEDVPSLLRRIQDMVGQKDCKLLSVIYFRKAFNVGIGSISVLPGWHGFGGELSDARVNTEVLPILEDYRNRGG